MKDRLLTARLARVAAFVAFVAAWPAVAGPLELKYVVIVSRHGVRSPTWDRERLNEYSSQPWPDWGVAPGELTPHGRDLIKILGSYYREWLTGAGLLQRRWMQGFRPNLYLGRRRSAHSRDGPGLCRVPSSGWESRFTHNRITFAIRYSRGLGLLLQSWHSAQCASVLDHNRKRSSPIMRPL